MTELNAIITISYRDLLKFMRDPLRVVATLIFPVIFIGILGGSFESNLGDTVQYDFLTFIFTGVFAQTIFQSAAMGLISLVEDRENDFSQEMFISPISRYSIIFGKIMGESLVAMVQGLTILLFGIIIGVPISLFQVATLILAAVVAALFGGAFGVIVMANLSSQRAANQIFPFIMLPQFFLAGVFSPIKILPPYLDFFSRISPMRYAVDLTRGLFYAGQPEYNDVVLTTPTINLTIMLILFLFFLITGTWFFVRNERNK